MTYHMSRVLAEYKTAVRELSDFLRAGVVSPPGAEFAIMHFQILSAGDSVANLVQWLSMVGSAIRVSLLPSN